MFVESKLKIDRARSHLGELATLLETHLRTHPPKSAFEKTEVGFSIGVQVKAAPPVAGAIIGDIVHNLRAALDLLAVELVTQADASTRDVYFPFAQSAAHLEEMIRKKKFDRAGTIAVKTLREVAPYQGGNSELRGLHDLDIQDKHRAIIPTNSLVTTPAIEVIPGSFEAGKIEMRMVPGSEAAVQWTFPADVPFAGREVLATLAELEAVVVGTIDKFEVALSDGPSSHT